MRVIQSMVAWLRLAFRHVTNELFPDLSLGHQSRLRTGHRLNVSRDSFFKPVMVVIHGREREVDHLMDQHPVIFGFRNISIAANADEDEAAALRIGYAVPYAGAIAAANSQCEIGDREAAIIPRYRQSRRFHPIQQFLPGKSSWNFGQARANAAAADVENEAVWFGRAERPHQNQQRENREQKGVGLANHFGAPHGYCINGRLWRRVLSFCDRTKLRYPGKACPAQKSGPAAKQTIECKERRRRNN